MAKIKLSKKAQDMINVFKDAAETHGYLSDQGSPEEAKASGEVSDVAEAKLKRYIARLEKKNADFDSRLRDY